MSKHAVFQENACCHCCSVAKSYPILWPHTLQHTWLLCPSLSLGVCSNSCPLNRWCHPTISFSVAPFSSNLQSFPTSGAFPMSQFFTSGGHSIGTAASTSVLPMNYIWQKQQNLCSLACWLTVFMQRAACLLSSPVSQGGDWHSLWLKGLRARDSG